MAFPGAAEPDARRLGEGDEHGRPEGRPPERADASQHGDQADQDRERRREHGLRVDEEDVLGVEGAAQRRERGGAGDREKLVAREGDAQALGRVRILADRAEVVPEARALDEGGQAEHGSQEGERDVVVGPLGPVELEVDQGLRLDREPEAPGAADRVPVDRDGLDGLSDADRGDREVVAAEPEARVADRLGDQDGERHAGQHPEPGRDAPPQGQHGGGVGADPEEDGAPEGDLAAVAAEQVPGLGEEGVEEDPDHHVARVGLDEDPREGEQRDAEPGQERASVPVRHRVSTARRGPGAARAPPGGRSRRRRRT